MDISTKFSIGDEIYIIEKYSEEHKYDCPVCGGSGKILGLDKSEQKCPGGCWGSGFKTKRDEPIWHVYGENYIPRPFTVTKIQLVVDEFYPETGKTYIEYERKPYNNHNMNLEKDCFGSLEDAQKECKKRNARIK